MYIWVQYNMKKREQGRLNIRGSRMQLMVMSYLRGYKLIVFLVLILSQIFWFW